MIYDYVGPCFQISIQHTSNQIDCKTHKKGTKTYTKCLKNIYKVLDQTPTQSHTHDNMLYHMIIHYKSAYIYTFLCNKVPAIKLITINENRVLHHKIAQIIAHKHILIS